MIKLLELFGGIGACSKALERCGIEYEIADYVEIDKYAVKSYNAMHNSNFEPQDITTWDKDIDVDLIMHGSPCQDFSIAGNNAGGDKGSGTRSSLMYETIRIVEKLKPKVVIWENVKNLLSKKHKHNFDAYLEYMHGLGYENYYKVLNAKNYGIPQNRERIFTISIRGTHKPFTFPEEIPLELRLKDMLEPVVDEKFYLSQKMLDYFQDHNKRHTEKGTGFIHKPTDINGVAKCLRANAALNATDNTIECRQVGDLNHYKNDQMNRVYSVDGLAPTVTTKTGGGRETKVLVKEATKKGYAEAYEGDSINMEQPNSKTRRGRVGHVVAQTLTTSPQQAVVESTPSESEYIGNISSKFEYVKKKTKEILDEKGYIPNMYNPYNRSEITDLAPTQTANCASSSKSSAVLIKDDYLPRIRKLTPLECWRLMGFDDSDFRAAEEVNSNTQLYKQAGNSIVVNVLCEILNNLREVLEMNKTSETTLTVFETEKFFDIAALAEKEPELFEELVNDYPVASGTYQYKVG